jgi:hypothetical protein
MYVYLSLTHTALSLPLSLPTSLPLSLPVQNRVIQALRTLPVHLGLANPFCVTSFCLLQVLTSLAPTSFSEETCCAEWGTKNLNQCSRIRVRMYVYVFTSHVSARGLRTPTICSLEIKRTRTLEPCPKPETPRSLWATPWTPVYVEMYV